MCGIVGFNWEDKGLLKKALEEIHHRGPDGQGIFIDKGVSLGHKRLSIIDLSEAGKQPLSNENGDIWIVFNGEIYNYKELKNSIQDRHKFSSNTDTEVLVHLYEEKGVKMLNDLIGMFAFCIYDSKKNIFFLARDRVGKKPLYYMNHNNRFMFCSEIKGILKDDRIYREVDLDALSYFLSFRSNVSENTMFKGIKKIMPGNFAIYELKKNKITLNKYWALPNSVEKMNFYSAKSALKNLLYDSVKYRLISDVPYGAYLSGGVDSGIIVSLMSQLASQPIRTFSVGFEEEKTNEIEEARFLSESIGTDHHEIWINKNAIKNLPDIIYHSDEPISDPTSIAIYHLSKYTKKYCSVILTGEGSDEIFCGYPQYKFMKIHQSILRKTPSVIKRKIPSLVNNLPDFILNKGFKFASSLGKKGKERFSNFILTNDLSKQYLEQVTIFNEKEKSELYNYKGNLYSRYNAKYFSKDKKNIVTNCQKIDFEGNMVEDLLMKLDKNTMAFSIEARAPFLDHRIVELAFKMPESFKLKGYNKDKYILRKAFKNVVPKPTLERKKRHFFVPIDNWISDELSSIKSELFSERFINNQGIFKYDYIKNIEKNIKDSKLFYSRQIWSLICFQIWYKLYIQNEKVKL